MSVTVRVLVLVTEEETIPLLTQPIKAAAERLGLEIDCRAFRDFRVAIGDFYVRPPNHLFLSFDYLDMLQEFRASQPRLSATFVPEGDWIPLLTHGKLGKPDSRLSNPLRVLNEPDVDMVLPHHFKLGQAEAMVRDIRKNLVISAARRRYSPGYWNAYQSAIDAVSINQEVVAGFKTDLAGLAHHYPGRTLLVCVGGAQGAGKTRIERIYRNFAKQSCDNAVDCNKVDGQLVEAYKRVKHFLVPTISTTRGLRPGEDLNERDWQPSLDPSRFMMTWARGGYRNALSNQVIKESLYEFRVINAIRRQAGQAEPLLPIMMFLRYPVPQALRQKLFPKASTYPAVKTFFLQTSLASAPLERSYEQSRRVSARGYSAQNGLLPDRDSQVFEQLLLENLRFADEIAAPLEIYDGAWVNELNSSDEELLDQILLSLTPQKPALP